MWLNSPGDDLGLVHITDEGLQRLPVLKVSQTHVFVSVSHLSLFGLLWFVWSKLRGTAGQVLLLLRPPSERLEMDVFLLPTNVFPKEVRHLGLYLDALKSYFMQGN